MRLFRCPRCGKGPLFSGLVAVAPACSACGLSYSGHEQGDGPAFFGILVVGTLAGIGAALLEVFVQPNYWVHAVLWGPLIVLGGIASLRFGKAALIATQYRLRREDFQP